MGPSRWRRALELVALRRPGSAFDRLFAGTVEELTAPDVRAIRLQGSRFIQGIHPACFGTERIDRLNLFKRLLDGTVAPRAFAQQRGRIAFPVVVPGDASRDAFVEVAVSLGGADADEVPAEKLLDSAAVEAVRDALAAVRHLFRTERRFVVSLPDLPIEGASLGLAVALAAVSSLTGWLVDERWAVTGRVGVGGQIETVGHMDRKRALRASERPASRMLGPADGVRADDGWTGVASLQDAIAQVFGPDLTAARRGYLEWAGRVAMYAERRGFAGPGVSPEPLASRELGRVYVEPDLESDGAQRAHDLARRLEAEGLDEGTSRHIREQYKSLTGSEHEPGVTKSDRRRVTAVVARHPLLVICGDAGMGKSMLLQHLDALELVEAQRLADAPIPVRFSVGQFPEQGNPTLGAYALGQLRERWMDLPESTSASWSAAIVHHLQAGRAVLLLDGFNEAAVAARRAVVDAIDAYVAAHPTARVVLTTRRSAYDVPLRGQFEVWHLAPLDRRQRRDLLERNAVGRDAVATVWRFFEENIRLADLAGNPFFLILVTLLAQADAAGVSHRVQLYENAFDRLWRAVPEQGIAWRRAVFAHVAAAQLGDGRSAERAPRLERRIDAARADVRLPAESETTGALLRGALEQAGLLVRGAGGALSFFHPSFQEYLAAVELTRAPLAEVPARVRARRAAQEWSEVVLLALGRLVHVLDAPEEAARALRALSAPDDASETITGSGLLTAWQAFREGLADAKDDIWGEIVARLAARVREIPDQRAAETLVLALLHFERTASARPEVLRQLILLAEAEHPVPWMARHYALQAVAWAAPQVLRAAAACRHAWERFARQDLPEGVVAAMLVDGVELDETMLAPLGRALDRGWLEPIAEALARDAVRHRANLHRLVGAARGQDAAVCATLALLAVRSEAEVEAALARHLEKPDMLAGKVLAYLARRQPWVLARVLEGAAESKERARLVATTVARDLAPTMVVKHVVPWLLAAPLDCALAWLGAFADDQRDAAARTAMHDALRVALDGPPPNAARAAALLTARMAPVVGDMAERVAAEAPRLVPRVEGTAARELLRALNAIRLHEPARELLTRLVRTREPATLKSILRELDCHDPAMCRIVVGRMADGVVAGDHDSVVACAQHLTAAGVAPAEIVAALGSVDDGAPLLLQAEAAVLLVRQGVREVGVARTLARAVGARVASPRDYRMSMALDKVVEEGCLRDEETFRLLVPGFVDGSDQEAGHALETLLHNDDALFEIVLDALVAAADPARQESARRAVVALMWKWSQATPPDERLLCRFEARFPRSPLPLHQLEVVAHGRQYWYEALDRALADVDRDPEEALLAARQLGDVLAAADAGHGRALAADERNLTRPRIAAVLRRLMEHEDVGVVLQAANELVSLGERDVGAALYRALAGPPMLALRAAIALYGLRAENDRVVATLQACLSSDVTMCHHMPAFVCMPELAIAEDRLAAVDGGAVARDRGGASAGDVQDGDDGAVIGDARRGLEAKIVCAPTVAHAAAWLLVAMRRVEVVPTLLDWLEGKDPDRCDGALAMLTALGADGEPRAIAWRIRELRAKGWILGRGISQWLWRNAPEADDHVDVLVSLLAAERHAPEVLRGWLTRCCAARADWAERVAVVAESQPAAVRVALAVVLARAGRLTELLARRSVVECCELEPAFLHPLRVDLVAAIDTNDVLAAAWRRHLAEGARGARVAAAGRLQRWDDRGPGPLRDAMAEAFRAGLDDEDLRVRLDALEGIARLEVVDDGAALAARRILAEAFGEAPTRVIDGTAEEQAAWEARAVTIRRQAALLLLSWDRYPEVATRWLFDALRMPWPAWALEEIVDALRARGGHDHLLRASLEAWLREHPAGTPGEKAIVERAQQVGVAADALDRRALEALGASPASEAHAVVVLFGREFADDHCGDPFLRRHSRDPSERALYWAERLAEAENDVARRVLRILAAAVGAAPETISVLVEMGAKAGRADVRGEVADLVRRRDGDGFLEELARAFLLRWMGRRVEGR